MTDQSSKKYNDAATKKIWSVLHSSWWNSQEKMTEIKQLIADGAYVNDVDKDGNTPLMYACDKCFIDEVLVLLEAGASVLPKNKDGQTALDFAKGNDTADREKIIALLEEEIPELKQKKAEEEEARSVAIQKAQEEANRQFNLALLQANEHSVQEMLFLVLNELRSINDVLASINSNTLLTEQHTYDLLFKYNY